MIGRITGILVEKRPPLLLVDVSGVGYEIEAPMSVFYNLPETGQRLTLVTHLAIKDDAHTLYGFASESERALFRNLLKVSGIGAKLGLTILSGVSADELASLVQDGNATALTRLPGIGKKTAERLIVELRDKLAAVTSEGGGSATGAPGGGSAMSEASQALVALGYKPQETQRMLKAVAKPDMDTESLIRLALAARVKAQG